METERLILREYEDSDADRLLDILGRMEVIKWLGNPPYEPMADRDEALEWIARWSEVHGADGRVGAYAIEIAETGVVAGTTQVTRLRRDGEFIGEYEIGWQLHPDSRGQGYATEAAAALITHTFSQGIDELWCGMLPHNVASLAVAKRLGLPPVALSDMGWDEDPWYGGEGPLFKVTRDEWATRDRD